MMVPARALLALCLVHVLGLFSLVAYAQPVPATDPVPRVAFPLRVTGNVTTVGPRTIDAANAAKFSFGAAANGSVFAETGLDLPTPGGRSVPITAHGTVPKASVAAALGRFARKALPVVSTGFALYDLANELEFAMSTSGGQAQFTRTVSVTTYAAICQDGRVEGTLSALGAACAAQAQAYWRTQGYTGCTMNGSAYAEPYSTPPHMYVYLGTTESCGYNSNRVLASPVSTNSSPQPATVEEFEAAIAAKAGWPSSSALGRALRDAVQSGEVVPVEVPQLSGPATSPGPVTQTDSPADNKRTTTTTTNQHAYDGPNVTTTVQRVTQVTDLTTGAPIGSPVVTTETPALRTPTEQPEIKTCGLPGTPPCKIDETGTPSTLPSNGQEALSTAADARDAIIPSITSTTDKNTSWGLVPKWLIGSASCSPTVLFTLPPVLGSRDVGIDFCPHLDAIYLVMNFLWLAWTMQGCIALVRDTVVGG